MTAKRFIIHKKSRHYIGGPGSDGKIHKTAELALEVAVEYTQRNPVGYTVEPYRAIKCEVCGGPHVEEYHTPSNV
jgi:hypothetical protein